MFESELTAAHEIADRAGEIALSFFRHDPEVTWKPDATPVTEADIAVEKMIREELARRFPADAILGEEGGIEGDSDRMWIVDPIDGTRNYAAGIQIWANLLALKVDGEYVVGLANAPALGERYAATKGGGATWNGREIRVSDIGATAQGMVVLGDLEAWAGTPRGDAVDATDPRGEAEPGIRRLLGPHARGARSRRGHDRAIARRMGLRVAGGDPHRGRRSCDAGGRVGAGPRRQPVSSNGLVHDEVLAALSPAG